MNRSGLCTEPKKIGSTSKATNVNERPTSSIGSPLKHPSINAHDHPFSNLVSRVLQRDRQGTLHGHRKHDQAASFHGFHPVLNSATSTLGSVMIGGLKSK